VKRPEVSIITKQPCRLAGIAVVMVAIMILTAACRAVANEADSVAALLAADEPPAGVVFEIVSDDEDALVELLPALKTDIERLRARFPDLPVAIVTHGTEQFALVAGNRANAPELHAITEELVTTGDVDVHVCGAHAGWYGVLPGDFPDYVDVAAAGPAQINDYRALDYVLIVLP
jgi:intracellular sulfur oxidation DsrE/DsrF family protein